MKFEMIDSRENRTQNKCENDNFNVTVIAFINSITCFIDEKLLQILSHDVETLHCLLSKLIKSLKSWIVSKTSS